MAEREVVLELRGITKRFPGVLANDRVDFDLRRGEIHALLGENGAGKSTLMNILYGLYTPDEGEIVVRGEAVRMSSPREAIERGIGMVHQHFMLIPVMTVAENIVLAVEPTRAGGLLDYRAASRTVSALAGSFGFAIDPNALIEDITVGQQQRVEILKALYRRADILILDEPTAVLTPQESTELFGILRNLVREGMSVIFISHKLNEVLEIADRVTVLRRGKLVETVEAKDATEDGLAQLMVGREVLLRVDKVPASPGERLLAVEHLHVRDDRGLEKVRDVSLEVKAGEIVGIAGAIRRSSSPHSRRGAWTSAPSSSSIGASWRSGTREEPCCSSPWSWTRSSDCPTESSSCSRGASSVSSSRTRARPNSVSR